MVPVTVSDTPEAEEDVPAPTPVLMVTLVPPFRAALISPVFTTEFPAVAAVPVLLISIFTGSNNHSRALTEMPSVLRKSPEVSINPSSVLNTAPLTSVVAASTPVSKSRPIII